MKLTTKQLKQIIKEELGTLMEMDDKIRELEDKIEMLRQHAEDRSDGDPEFAEKIFIQYGGDKLEKELNLLKNGSGEGLGTLTESYADRFEARKAAGIDDALMDALNSIESSGDYQDYVSSYEMATSLGSKEELLEEIIFQLEEMEATAKR